jgi:hypothetical protein
VPANPVPEPVHNGLVKDPVESLALAVRELEQDIETMKQNGMKVRENIQKAISDLTAKVNECIDTINSRSRDIAAFTATVRNQIQGLEKKVASVTAIGVEVGAEIVVQVSDRMVESLLDGRPVAIRLHPDPAKRGEDASDTLPITAEPLPQEEQVFQS